MIHTSAPQTPRARRREATRRRILAEALQLIAEGGLAALSIHELAERVDYTPGALYRYFASKDALLAAVVVRVLEDLRGELEAAAARVPARAVLQRVLALAEAYPAFARREPHRFGLLATMLAEPKVLLPGAEATPVMQAMTSALEPVHEALEQAAQRGCLDAGDAAERTLVLFAALQGALQLHKQARHAPELVNVGRLVQAAVRGLLSGWGAQPRSLERAWERVRELNEAHEPTGATG